MIARVQTLTKDGDNIIASVLFLDGTPLVEVGVQSFTFTSGTTNQQAKADIMAAGKVFQNRKVEIDRLTQALAPGTEYTI